MKLKKKMSYEKFNENIQKNSEKKWLNEEKKEIGDFIQKYLKIKFLIIQIILFTFHLVDDWDS